MDLHELSERLMKLPGLIASKEVEVINALESYEKALNTHNKNVAKEKTIQFAKMRLKQLTKDEAQGWVDMNTLDGELLVIAAKSNYKKLMSDLNELNNEFIALRKMEGIKKIESNVL